MENDLLLKSIEMLLDRKLQPINDRLNKIDEKLENLEKTQRGIETTQKSILNFITEADTEFMKLEEKTKDIDKIKKVININNVK
ncbi:hypothetical protein [Crassaminicella indica]|uniref:Uncharacterized protein n=2 Tax=Crassaminicella indica TaxID=2855394 RepID=A0ABX8RE11_9CLOT|nr:hypothetical protein [Crassaminicella indica]QXM06662.1 hypothetical protein KVH43_02775 [Crassaminicella indica]